jgi:hypothetical protein
LNGWPGLSTKLAWLGRFIASEIVRGAGQPSKQSLDEKGLAREQRV